MLLYNASLIFAGSSQVFVWGAKTASFRYGETNGISGHQTEKCVNYSMIFAMTPTVSAADFRQADM